jgi:hypothetical protein
MLSCFCIGKKHWKFLFNAVSVHHYLVYLRKSHIGSNFRVLGLNFSHFGSFATLPLKPKAQQPRQKLQSTHFSVLELLVVLEKEKEGKLRGRFRHSLTAKSLKVKQHYFMTPSMKNSHKCTEAGLSASLV